MPKLTAEERSHQAEENAARAKQIREEAYAKRIIRGRKRGDTDGRLCLYRLDERNWVVEREEDGGTRRFFGSLVTACVYLAEECAFSRHTTELQDYIEALKMERIALVSEVRKLVSG